MGRMAWEQGQRRNDWEHLLALHGFAWFKIRGNWKVVQADTYRPCVQFDVGVHLPSSLSAVVRGHLYGNRIRT